MNFLNLLFGGKRWRQPARHLRRVKSFNNFGGGDMFRVHRHRRIR